jgi:hypothetical protein
VFAIVLLPDAELPVLPVGTVLRGRVLPDRALLLDGVRFPAATLPSELRPGELLRLEVTDVQPDRLALQVVDRTMPPPPPPVLVPLPGGAQLLVERDGGARAAAGEPPAVTVRFDAPRLGRMDVRLDLDGAAVHVGPGALDEALAAASTLAQALSGATGRPARVSVLPRGVDLHA